VLTLRWRRVEPGLWAAGPYELRRRKSGSWRIVRGMVAIGEASTLRVAKRLCVEDYALYQG